MPVKTIELKCRVLKCKFPQRSDEMTKATVSEPDERPKEVI